jgi:hypothetical protein
MDGLSKIATIFTGGGSSGTNTPLWQKILLGGMFGAGELGNLLSEHKASALQDKQAKYLDYVTNLIQHPELISKMATAEAAPLSQALQQSIGNTVQASMAERGLSQAPGIFAASQAQALAPYQQQNYNTALNAVLSQLGIPISASSAVQTQKPQDLSNLLSLFLKSTAKPIQTQTSTPGVTLPTTSDTGLQFPFPDISAGAPA